ncbi:hypothetical protein HISP_12715 [Haloarcula hispanica N601]|uniref:MarR family transcriptional regulator n=3 Tax=Haloarcula hispanica TaxID=51589 RepID=A0A482T1I2_HALHI|nr:MULTISPECIES: hypothetical protein [Haloarcula]AEM58085.1 conserved hypothetical protein [Haloarcula hispanica ATCC 33960]AHB66829.1 hypothetical protein HISP_12715 [Haloarcula hispanica N601]AJF25132.1 hypothetical protein SG26_05025 [Haloarcula sp. CBA1115]KAA9406250.1 hypothetical protein Har1131_05315 [Haloarcula sp. CBA1131]KAA9410716.1 hypothetical protein EGO51_13195 [Haloarcula hispanica]
MGDEEDIEDETVSVSMEISGNYDEVMSKLATEDEGSTSLVSLLDDLEQLLDTVVRMDGGTRSAIAQQLPEDMAVSFDAQAVVDTLQVLERYDLVVLEGNTWKPGPKLTTEE